MRKGQESSVPRIALRSALPQPGVRASFPGRDARSEWREPPAWVHPGPRSILGKTQVLEPSSPVGSPRLWAPPHPDLRCMAWGRRLQPLGSLASHNRSREAHTSQVAWGSKSNERKKRTWHTVGAPSMSSPHPLRLPVPSPPGLSLSPQLIPGQRWKELGDHLGGQPRGLQKGSRAKHNIRLLKMWIVNTSVTGQNTVATGPQPSCFAPVAAPPAAPGSGMAPRSTGTGTGRVFPEWNPRGPGQTLSSESGGRETVTGSVRRRDRASHTSACTWLADRP